jgi:hypothetical protein
MRERVLGLVDTGATFRSSSGLAPLAFVLFALLWACGGSTPEAEEPTGEATPPPVEPEAWLPPDSELVARIDLASIRQSPFFDTIAGFAVQAERALAERGVAIPLGTGRLLGGVDQIYLGLLLTREEGVAILRHRIPAEELDAALRAAQDDRHAPVFTRFDTVRDHQAWIGEDLEAADLGGGVLAIATTGKLADVMARHGVAAGRGPLDQPRLAALAARAAYDEGDVGVVATFNEVLKERMRRRGRSADEIDALGARLSIANGVDGFGVADTASPTVATDLAMRAMSEISAIRRQPMVAMLGLTPALAGTTVRAESKSVIGEVHISREDTADLIGRLSGFLTIALESLAAELGPSASIEGTVE